MFKRLYRMVSKVAFSLLSLLSTTAAHATGSWRMNMHRGVTPMSHDIYDLHMTVMIVCVLIAIGTFGVLIFSIFKYRKSRGAVAANFHENLKVEILWTLIPCFILIALAIPATKTLIRMDDTSRADITIKVVGYQWKWQYQYLDEGISFFSNILIFN